MKITVDCRMLGSSGIGTYLKECLTHFLETDNHFLLLGDGAKLLPFIAGRANVTLAECAIRPFSVKELLFFPPGLTRKINGTDAYFSPYFNRVIVKPPVFKQLSLKNVVCKVFSPDLA
jgi:hypothetical protein